MTATRSARATVDTSEYRRSHFAQPRGRGGWMFRNADTGAEVTENGTYTEARRALPAGRWVVLP